MNLRRFLRLLAARRSKNRPRSLVRFWVVLFFGAVCAVGFITFLVFLRQTPPHAVIELKASYMRQNIDRPAAAKMALTQVTGVRSKGACQDVLGDTPLLGILEVSPSKGVDLVYRWRPKGMALTMSAVQGQSVGRAFYAGKRCDLGTKASFTLEPVDNHSLIVLPITGPASVGSETAGADHLMGGRITLFGRATLPPYSGVLFPASDQAILIAEGGRVSASPDLKTGASWFGTARVTDSGIVISATSETKGLQVIRPGERNEVERLAIGLLALLFKDPSVAPWTIGLVFVTAVMNMAISLFSLVPALDLGKRPKNMETNTEITPETSAKNPELSRIDSDQTQLGPQSSHPDRTV